MGNFMGYSSATELFTAIGNKIKAKQNAISDLETIRSGAAKGATAVQPATMTEALAAKQASLDQTQLAAVNSGITSEKVTQIETNKTNILCALNKTGTNWLYDYEHGMENPTTLSGVTFTWLKNGKLSIKSTGINTSNVWYDLEANIRSKYIGKILSFVGGVDNKCVLNVTTTGGTSVAVSSGDDVTIPSTGTNKVYILVLANAGEFDIVVEPMIRDATITSNTYSTPSLPNSDLTGLQAEDRAALAEVVDSGAKNLLQLPSGSATSYGITFSCDPNTGIVTANGTKQSGDCFMLLANISLTSFPRKFVAYCNNTENTKLCITIVPHRTNGTYASTIAIGTYTTVDLTSSTFDSFLIRAASYADAGITLSSEKIYPMLCTKAAFGVSSKFVPYQVPITGAMSVVDKEIVCSSTLTTTGIKFTSTEKAAYRITATAIYYNSIPMKLAIKHKISPSMSQGTLCTAVHVENEDVSLTVSGIRLLDVGGEFEIFAQYASSTNNRFYVLVEKIG